LVERAKDYQMDKVEKEISAKGFLLWYLIHGSTKKRRVCRRITKMLRLRL
jgi:hypothetical protein